MLHELRPLVDLVSYWKAEFLPDEARQKGQDDGELIKRQLCKIHVHCTLWKNLHALAGITGLFAIERLKHICKIAIVTELPAPFNAIVVGVDTTNG